MKCVRAILCLLAVTLLFSGCSMHLYSSVDDLISPLSPFGENAEIKKALDAFAPNGYSLKAAGSGEYISSYNFYDLNGDGVDEAITFFEPSDNLGTVEMAVIQKKDNTWTVVENIQGEGKEVDSLSFDDLDSDGVTEIFVTWDVIANSSNHVLCLYHFEETESDAALVQLDDNVTVNKFIAADFFGNGAKDLLLLEINAGNTQVNKAELYSLSGNELEKLGETKLDAHVSSYVKLSAESNEKGDRVFADGLGTDGTSMLTEIISWSEHYNTIISAFYKYDTGLTEETRRNLPIPSMDLDDDGVMEVPLECTYTDVEQEITVFDFKNYSRYVMMHHSYALYCGRDGYIVTVPDELADKVAAEYDDTTHEMTVTNTESAKTLFRIMPVLKATYSAEKYPNYTVILEENGYCYLTAGGDDETTQITAADLKNMIKVAE